MSPTRVLVAALAIAVPAAAGWLMQQAPSAPAVKRAQPIAVQKGAKKGPAIAGVALDKAFNQHTRLMRDANALKVSEVLPEPVPHSAGMAAKAVEQAKPVAALPDVPDGRKVALFFTGNVVGETDPCG